MIGLKILHKTSMEIHLLCFIITQMKKYGVWNICHMSNYSPQGQDQEESKYGIYVIIDVNNVIKFCYMTLSIVLNVTKYKVDIWQLIIHVFVKSDILMKVSLYATNVISAVKPVTLDKTIAAPLVHPKNKDFLNKISASATKDTMMTINKRNANSVQLNV